MAQEFRTGFDELARQAELDELKREVDALRRTTSLQEIRNELTKPLPTLEDYAGISKPAPAPALEGPEGPEAHDIADAPAPRIEPAVTPAPTEAAPDEAPQQAWPEPQAVSRSAP